MRILILSLTFFVSVISFADSVAAIPPKKAKVFMVYELEGKRSPIYSELLNLPIIYDLEMTKLASYESGDISKFEITKGKVFKTYKGPTKDGEEIEFLGGVGDWKLGDRMIISLAKNRKPSLILIKGRNENYDNFASAISPFAGKISDQSLELKNAILQMRKKIQNECAETKDKQEKLRCDKVILKAW